MRRKELDGRILSSQDFGLSKASIWDQRKEWLADHSWPNGNLVHHLNGST